MKKLMLIAGAVLGAAALLRRRRSSQRAEVSPESAGNTIEDVQDDEANQLEGQLRERATHTTHQKPGQQYAAADSPPE
jgi:hypothetical protein